MTPYPGLSGSHLSGEVCIVRDDWWFATPVRVSDQAWLVESGRFRTKSTCYNGTHRCTMILWIEWRNIYV